MGDNFDIRASDREDGPFKDYPPRASLLEDLYRPLPVLTIAIDGNSLDLDSISNGVVQGLSSALNSSDYDELHNLFYSSQAFYRDSLAMTYHKRTIKGPETISLALLELAKERETSDFQLTPGSQYMAVKPSLGFIHCFFTFKTSSPRAACGGKAMLLPHADESGDIKWKIWTLSTWLESLEDFPEDESRLHIPSQRKWKSSEEMTTDVVIIGGGNTGLILAARLKALGVDYVIIDENEKYGDNWAKRYDCLRFHVPLGFCQTPYLPYPSDVPEELTRDHLAAQMKRFGEAFDLDVIHGTRVNATTLDPSQKLWTLNLDSISTLKTIKCKHIALATGIGSWTPHVPSVLNPDVYTGTVMHSHHFKNAERLAAEGIKSALVIGSANTAFDVIEDCYNAGIKTTMIQRSRTYLIPLRYHHDPRGLGIYDFLPPDMADLIVLSGPVHVGGQLLALTHASLAAAEPDRYEKLKAAGFDVMDSTEGDLMHCLLERGGGHFVDMGRGVELISSGKVGIRSGAIPTAFTPNGLELSDGSTVEADAIIWCTGFKDTDIRHVLPDILGRGAEEIAAKMDATWALDEEGETRGMFKRHEDVDNLWVLGFGTAHQRWQSKGVSMQIKADLEGILPAAYRETPARNKGYEAHRVPN